MDADIVKWLEKWFKSQCDGDWEHECGINITTSDNPGWIVEIDVADAKTSHGRFLKFPLMIGTDSN